MKELVFYYDIICPYAYLASRLVEDLARRTGTLLKWRPVLLGGIYNATKSDTEKADSIKEGLNDTKKTILGQDLARLYQRYNVPCCPFENVPDVKTLYAMRLIASTPNGSDTLRAELSHSLFKLLWVENKDVSNLDVLAQVTKSLGMNVDVKNVVKSDESAGKKKLLLNTEEAVKRGAFGVPSFWANNKLYFGADRLHFVEGELSGGRVEPARMKLPQKSQRMKLTVFFDFTSPWSYIGTREAENVVKNVAPVQVDVEFVPFLLGALFNKIGTRQVPLMFAGENKRNYALKDLRDWCKFYSIPMKFPQNFPFNVLLPSRVFIVQPDDKLRNAIYDAGWLHDRNIGDKTVLKSILEENGYDAEIILEKATSPDVKAKLRENTQRAIDTGLCGAPSFQVNDGNVIWGQDRLNVVADLLCGMPDGIDQKEIVSKL